MPTITLVGAGNVASHIGPALAAAGYAFKTVVSRTASSAQVLAEKLSATALVYEPGLNLPSTDICLYCVSDDALPQLARHIAASHPEAVHIHTSGSTPADVFKPFALRYGVLYPMQTFTKDAQLNFRDIPCFVEGSDPTTADVITQMARHLSDRVTPLDFEARRDLHLAAVWACNFVNHCYHLAAEVISRHPELSFDMLLPLIDETARKVHCLSPREAQTGPAVRYDRRIIGMQLERLSQTPLSRDIYELMSRSIHQHTLTEHD
ncbi:MAG: Rossmann-like and DUF2520 domain-containing protein [Alloprevotella sp.]